MKKKLLSMLLVSCLIIGLLPTTVFAAGTGTDKAIQLGTGEISGYSDTNSYDYIYFGTWENSPVKWKVLDDQTNTGTDGLFLLSDELIVTHTDGNIGGVQFDDTSNKWQGSNAQTWCVNFVKNSFTQTELESLIKTTKDDEEYIVSGNGILKTVESQKILNEDQIFFLSLEEAVNTKYGFANHYNDDPSRVGFYDTTNPNYWYLRSEDSRGSRIVLLVADDGSIDGYTREGTEIPVRPAFNMNTSTVLFTSAATGKSSGTTGNLSTVSDYTGSEWKLTLLDNNRSFTANVNGQTSAFASAGESVQITYSGAQTGDNEYVSVLLCDSNNTVLYYGNIAQNSASGTATLNIPSGLTVGNYTLKVFSEQCNGDYKTDYASAFQNIDLQVILPRENTPNAKFDATGDSAGILSDVDVSMKYSTDGGTSWKDITGTSKELTGVTATNDVKVYKPGNGSTTSNSAEQTIDITQAVQPAVSGVDCTTSEQNNGQLTGVDSTMEYKKSDDSDWIKITGNTVTDLTNGTYDVRVKASGTVLASPAAVVTIGAHVCTAQGEWKYDKNEHWKLCLCGEKMESGVHTGGEATCTAPAVCITCQKAYGTTDPDKHNGEIVWVQTETTHKEVYNCCNAVVSEETEHQWENGTCKVCQYPCKHEGGEATCSQKAVCVICNSQYGELDPDNHKAVSEWTQENGKHYHKCAYGCETHLDEAGCSGGTATCIGKAVCEICINPYGDVDPSNHTNLVKTEAKPATHLKVGNKEYWNCDGCNKYFSDEAGTKEIALEDTVIPKLTEHTADDTGWHSDKSNHWNNCECGEVINQVAHTFKWVIDRKATSTEAGLKHRECTVCGYAEEAVKIPATGTTGGTTKPTDSDKEIPNKETKSVQTGDNSNVVLWICLLLVSGGAITGACFYGKKKRK